MKNAILINVCLDNLQVSNEKFLEEVRVIKGVAHAEILHSSNCWLNVVYETKSITSDKIIKHVKKWDKGAVFIEPVAC